MLTKLLTQLLYFLVTICCTVLHAYVGMGARLCTEYYTISNKTNPYMTPQMVLNLGLLLLYFKLPTMQTILLSLLGAYASFTPCSLLINFVKQMDLRSICPKPGSCYSTVSIRLHYRGRKQSRLLYLSILVYLCVVVLQINADAVYIQRAEMQQQLGVCLISAPIATTQAL